MQFRLTLAAALLLPGFSLRPGHGFSSPLPYRQSPGPLQAVCSDLQHWPGRYRSPETCTAELKGRYRFEIEWKALFWHFGIWSKGENCLDNLIYNGGRRNRMNAYSGCFSDYHSSRVFVRFSPSAYIWTMDSFSVLFFKYVMFPLVSVSKVTHYAWFVSPAYIYYQFKVWTFSFNGFLKLIIFYIVN